MSADVRVTGGQINVDVGMQAPLQVYTEVTVNHFALAAMQSLLSHPLESLQVGYATYQLECPVGKEPLEMVDWLADRAYQVAAAMERRRYK